MDWTTLVATLLGAGIATTTSVLADARKDRRESAADWLRTRRDLYAAFGTALAQARNLLLALSKQSMGMTADERDESARRVFAPCYEVRFRLELFAPREVVEPAVSYFRTVRGLRDIVAAGGGPADSRWERCMDEVKQGLAVAHEAMRQDMRAA